MRIDWNAQYRHLKRDEGSAMVEFSLIAFTFIILLLGVVEMGRLALVYTTMSNAARAGARYAIVHGSHSGSPSGPANTNTSQVQTVVRNFASAGLVNTALLTSTNIDVEYPDGTNTAGSRVSVAVQYPYDPLVSYFVPLLRTTLSNTSEGIITF